MAPKAASIESLLHRCKYTMGKVQRLLSELNEEVEEDHLPPAAVIKVRLDNLQRHQQAYNNLYAEILEKCPAEEFAEHDQQLDEFEEVCSSIRIQIESMSTTAKEEKPASDNSAKIIVHQQPLQVPMPKFDGSYEHWPKFKAMFTDIMSRSRDSDAIKLHHLNQALVGQAAGMLNASIIADNNFATAWKLLETRYENPRVIVEAHITGLLTMKRVDRECAKDLRVLAETCTRHVDGLAYMKHGLDSTSNLIVTKLLTACFDAETRKLWERSLAHGEFPELGKTLRFLTTQCEVLERCDTENKPKPKAKAYPAIQSTHNGETKASCIVCHGDHKIARCPEFLQLAVSDRFIRAKQAKLCINCLSSGHIAADCKSKWTCNKCRGRHHTLLHVEKVGITETTQRAPQQGALSLQCSGNRVSSTVLLSTVLLFVRDKGGKCHEARALLDSGSQLNFMSDRLAQVLRLPRVAVHIPVVGIGEAAANSVQQQVTATIRSRANDYEQTMKFAILPKPTTDLPLSDIDISRWKLPPGIVLADPTFHTSSKVDLILGAEHFVEVIREGKITVAANQPMLLETEFGWVVSGRSTQRIYNAVALSAISIEQHKFYEREEAPNKDTTTRAADEKYVVKLPRKPELVDALGEAKSNTLRRFLAIRSMRPTVEDPGKKIQQATAGSQWRHVLGVDNPADLVSRGCLGVDLVYDQRWWQGPSWLALDENEWPQTTTAADPTTVDAEEKVTSVSYIVSEAPLQYIFLRYSSLSKLRRMIGYWIKYMHRLSTKSPTTGKLSVQDLECADRALCRLAQAEHFKAELTALRNNEPIPKSSAMKWFNPVLSSDGIIRVGGRLQNSAESEEFRHPIIIPGKHPLATLMVRYYHENLLHAGPRLMLNSIRQRYWIISGRDLVRKVYHQCHTCFRCRPSQLQTLMADLPSERVTEARPFSISGVDYCGPVYVKGKHRKAVPTKAFVAVFVCFVTRAVHIELVSDLSTDAFLAALRRFVARRGLVSELHSDNGTNFKGAANALNSLYKLLHSADHQRAIQSWTIEKGINWKFIPPRAPHFGGLWEAAVRSMKHHLVRVVGTSSFSFEDMTTLLAEIECCLNSRPITALSDDPADMEALTPGHFLTGANMQLVPGIDLRDIPDNRLNHWQQVQQRARRFWDRWHVEYLQQLQPRTKWNKLGSAAITPGQLVIIREDNIPSTRWPLGRIVKVHPGKDGVIRVVTIRTAKAEEIVRPIVKICLLPTSS